jgi:lysozyme family protein
MAEGGAFIIALGPQACWTPGEYHGNEVWRQAEDSTILGHRDPDATYQRQGAPIVHGDIGVHHHGGGDVPQGNIETRAAGCQVIRRTADQSEFMHLTMQCPRYLADRQGYRLTATVLEYKDIVPTFVPKLAETPHPSAMPAPSAPEPVPNTDFAHCLAMVIVHEGGNDDDPNDPGGRTSRGIIQSEWNKWRASHPGLPSDVWKAPDDQIVAIYKANYWAPLLCDGLPSGVDYCVFDYGVNSGVSRSAKGLQSALGIKADGTVGKNTIAVAATADAATVINKMCDQRLAFLQDLPTWGTFGRGWSTRVSDVRRDALAMVHATPAPQPLPQPQPQPAPIPTQEPPMVDTSTPNTGGVIIVPAPPSAPTQPAAAFHLTDEQFKQMLAAAAQMAGSPVAQNAFLGLLKMLGASFPQFGILAYIGITLFQAFSSGGVNLDALIGASPTLALGGGLLAFLSQMKKAAAPPPK